MFYEYVHINLNIVYRNRKGFRNMLKTRFGLDRKQNLDEQDKKVFQKIFCEYLKVTERVSKPKKVCHGWEKTNGMNFRRKVDGVNVKT